MNHNFRKGPDDANGIIWASAIMSALGVVVWGGCQLKMGIGWQWQVIASSRSSILPYSE